MNKITFKPEEIFDEISFIELKEATIEYFSVFEISNIVKDCIKNLATIGLNISFDQLATIDIRDTQKLVAGIKPVSNTQYKLVISKYVLRKDKLDFLVMAIYHELCHLLRFNYLFNLDLITYTDTDKIEFNEIDKDKVYNLLQANHGHTDLWLMIANKINKNIKLVIPVVSVLNEKQLADIFLESTFRQDTILSIDPEKIFGDSIL